ncbi:MAG TPA: hypothetical protein VMX35_04380 [Acidobacteriota bacterium]|nr:hypothetical protein [Acidobacteriota bacterium]
MRPTESSRSSSPSRSSTTSSSSSSRVTVNPSSRSTVTTSSTNSGTQDRTVRSRQSTVEDRTQDRTVRSRQSGTSAAASSTGARTAVARTRNVELYGDKPVVRSRSGSYDASRDSKALADRNSAGRVRMRSGSAAAARAGSAASSSSAGRVAVERQSGDFSYARPEYVRNNYRFVSRTVNNTYVINRNYLIDQGGRWGHAHAGYNGRNYHFYFSLYHQGYFGVGVNLWSRRYYGDGWDFYFGWSPSAYVIPGWTSRGVYYFEPCYAFSFTFNHGYERGYIEGFRTGVRDWNYSYPYNSWAYSYNGYDYRYGAWDEYRDGYEQGFGQGYYAGYSGVSYGYNNFGFGDFRNYPVVYDFDYDYYERASYDDDYEYEDGYDDYDYDEYGEDREYRPY